MTKDQRDIAILEDLVARPSPGVDNRPRYSFSYAPPYVAALERRIGEQDHEIITLRGRCTWLVIVFIVTIVVGAALAFAGKGWM